MYGAKKQAQNMDSNIQSKPLFFAAFLCMIHEKCKKTKTTDKSKEVFAP